MCPRTIESFDEGLIDRLLNRALARLVEHDNLLFLNDASERSICHRLAYHLQTEFPDFDVDCEYNRHFGEADFRKRLRSEILLELAGRSPKIDDDDSVTAFPDIIVHRRNTPENLLVIEAKKTTSTVSDKYDVEKLKAYRKELGYRFAKFLQFGTKGEKHVTRNEFVKPDESLKPS